MSFPGTLGYDAVDGVIADAEVIPHGGRSVLPRARVATAALLLRQRQPPRAAARADAARANALPEDALVLACLNQSSQAAPAALRDLARRAARARRRGAVAARAAIRACSAICAREAERAGVDPARLVFAPPLPQDAHIARLACADLALDTLPYGSHTTGCDALWCGVPMLTCRGATFAGRVGASLLKAAGLPELVASSLEEYGARLLELVVAPDATARVPRLSASARARPIRCSTRAGFTRDWEALLLRLYDDARRR